ncbi:hypothetical protein HY251_02155 [bacterium]|nr:hypothetical protein [bacterium]
MSGTMRAVGAGVVLLAVALVAPRRAEAAVEPGSGAIELRPEARLLEPRAIDVRRESWSDLVLDAGREPEPLRIEMPEILPDRLELSVRWSRLELSVTAELGGDDIPLTPRIDCTNGETYFWTRASYDATDKVMVFAESFQGAGCILGGKPIPRCAWDGVQLQAGVRLKLSKRWTLEAGPVVYALSPTHRKNQVGTRVSLCCSF